mgnify:CR=1 FL=1
MWGLLAGAMLSLAQAKTTYSSALSVEEQQQFLYYFYEAQRLLQKQDISTAWELVQFCHELNPNDATINNYMGVFLCSFDRSDEALPYLQRAFELQPNEYWYDYAVYLLRCNDKKLEKIAIRNLETVARNNPKNEEVHTLLQKAYIHYNNDYKRALLVQNRLDSILGYNAMSAMQRYQLNVMDNNPKRAIYEVERYLDEEPNDMQESIALFEHYDHIWQTRNEWEVVYAMIGPFAEENEDQYALLVNNTKKEYMIMHSDHLENGYEDEHFHFVSQDEYVALVEQLKKDGYTVLSCSEEYYYMEINDQ